MATLLAFWEMKPTNSQFSIELKKSMESWTKHKLYGQNYK
jgi:hypothetical protein